MATLCFGDHHLLAFSMFAWINWGSLLGLVLLADMFVYRKSTDWKPTVSYTAQLFPTVQTSGAVDTGN